MTDKILLYKNGTLSAGNFIETAGSPILLQKGSKILCSEFIEIGDELSVSGAPFEFKKDDSKIICKEIKEV